MTFANRDHPTLSPSPNTHILLPSGITVVGVEDWVTKLADVA